MHCTVGDSVTPSSSKRMLPAPAGALVSSNAGSGFVQQKHTWSKEAAKNVRVPVCWKAGGRLQVQC